jgi:copper chaperone CopZ
MKYQVILATFVIGAIFGCSDAELETTEATPAAFNAAGGPTVEFSVPDMMCPDSCAVKTKEILAGQAGAKDVRVDFEAKTATVVVNEGEFDADAALAALVDHGFDHSTLKRGAGGTNAN